MGMVKLFLSIVSGINIFIIVNMYLFAPTSIVVWFASIILLSITIPILIFISSNKLKIISINASIISSFLILMDVLFFFRIIGHPAINTWNTKSKSVEVLDVMPYVKFKPNTLVRMQDGRGDDFTYQWLTDDFGYKNDVSLKLSKKADFIALGDSFTEGMGVSVSNIWSSKISKNSSFRVYNAGVQGYSVSQIHATYKNIMKKISHKGIIIGTLPNIYKREKFFDKSKNIANHGTGGIKYIADREKSMHNGQNSFLVAFMRAVIIKLKEDTQGTEESKKECKTENKIMSKSELLANLNWKSYIYYLNEIIKIALNNGKRIILVKFPTKCEVKSNSESQYYNQLNLLQLELLSEVEIIDILPYLKDDWNLSKKFMYFSKDGHMNEYGNKIVSDFLIKYLKK